MKKHLCVVCIVLLSVFACQRPSYRQLAAVSVPDYKIDRFESTIRGYEKADSVKMPTAGGVLFTGSSSFYFWKTIEKDLSPLPVINRAFGGSTFAEVIYYAERSILKYKPATVVIYCENDLFGTAPTTITQVRDSYVRLVQKIRTALPKTQIYFVGMKPSPLRWSRWNEASDVNRMIKEFMKTDKRQSYIDVSDVLDFLRK
jgi:hypothetical protein